MFTIAWLIRSFQGTLGKGYPNMWQDEWFMSFLITTLTMCLDLAIFIAFIGLIK